MQCDDTKPTAFTYLLGGSLLLLGGGLLLGSSLLLGRGGELLLGLGGELVGGLDHDEVAGLNSLLEGSLHDVLGGESDLKWGFRTHVGGKMNHLCEFGGQKRTIAGEMVVVHMPRRILRPFCTREGPERYLGKYSAVCRRTGLQTRPRDAQYPMHRLYRLSPSLVGWEGRKNSDSPTTVRLNFRVK